MLSFAHIDRKLSANF